MNTTDGVDTNSNARLKIVFDNANVLLYNNSSTTASAHVYIGTEEITSDIPAANFKWEKVAENGTVTSNWKTGVKSVSLTQADLSGATEIRCKVSRTSEYGTVQVDNSMMASHTPAVDDANDKFSVVDGNLMLDTTDTENPYIIEDNCLKVEAGLGVDLTAKAVVYPELPDKVVEFKYNADGLRTQKKVILPSGRTETTEYILHGKLITEMRKGQDVLHFFYDAKTKPISVKYNDEVYTYVYNLQGDIVGILNSAGNLVVEYKYDAWGRILSMGGSMETTLGSLNPSRYRGYVWDEDIGLYYIESRYYNPIRRRFENVDKILDIIGELFTGNPYIYCLNSPVYAKDIGGYFCVLPPFDYKIEDEIPKYCLHSDQDYGYILGLAPTGLSPNSYYPFYNKDGSLKIEWWTDNEGKVIHARHYTNHGNPKKHPVVPHDHDWYKDDKGNWTENPKYLEVDSRYQSGSGKVNEEAKNKSGEKNNQFSTGLQFIFFVFYLVSSNTTPSFGFSF